MSMKATCQLRYVRMSERVKVGISFGWPQFIDKSRNVLQQLWVDEADARITEWRDVPLVTNEE